MGESLRLGAVVAMVLVTAYCLARTMVPAWHSGGPEPSAHWHLAMSVVMLLALTRTPGPVVEVVLVALSGLGAVGALRRLRLPELRSTAVRLLLSCVAMGVMLVPDPAASAAPPESAMPGMNGTAVTTSSLWLGALLCVALVLVVLAGRCVAQPGSRTPGARLGGCCDLLMGLAMVAMLLPALG